MLRTFEFKERRLGLRFVGRKGDVYVKNVILGLEAERVGVLEGDVIVSVNGTSVRSIRNTMDLLKSRPLRVTFRRGKMNGTSLLQYWKVVWSGGLNLRRDPSPRAEIVGIARFGEVYLSTKKQGDWICVANKSSLGESWVLSKSDDEMYMCRTTKTAAETTTTTANILKKTSSSSLKNETQQQSTLSQDNEKLSSQSRDLDKPSIEPLPPSLSHNHDNHHNNKHNNNNNKLNFETLEKFGYGGYENTAIYREYSHQVKHLQASEKRKIESIKQLKRERQKRKREDEKREKERIQKLLDLNAQERSTLQAIFHDRKISSVEKKKKKRKKIGQDSITTTTNTITHNTDDSNLHSVRSNPWLRNNSNQTF
jgi:hypothetical protein